LNEYGEFDNQESIVAFNKEYRIVLPNSAILDHKYGLFVHLEKFAPV
jgi:hypothetical protein